MKAINHSKVLKGYFYFTIYLLLAVAVVQVCIYSFFTTAEAEVVRIKMKTEESERVYNEQNTIVESFDEIFVLYNAFEVSEEVNPDFLMRSIVTRKMDVATTIKKLPVDEVLVHAHLLSRLDDLLHVRDSISSLRKTEQTLKEDLIQCGSESRTITRKMRVGKLGYSKK